MLSPKRGLHDTPPPTNQPLSLSLSLCPKRSCAISMQRDCLCPSDDTTETTGSGRPTTSHTASWHMVVHFLAFPSKNGNFLFKWPHENFWTFAYLRKVPCYWMFPTSTSGRPYDDLDFRLFHCIPLVLCATTLRTSPPRQTHQKHSIRMCQAFDDLSVPSKNRCTSSDLATTR